MNQKERKALIHHFQVKILPLAIGVLCLLPVLSGCRAEEPKEREAIQALQCTQPAAFSTIRPTGGAQMVVNWADYEKECTTVQIVDVAADTVCREITMDGVWEFKEQAFSDGRFALCNWDTNTWKFLNTSLEDAGTWSTENMGGFFSYDGSTYYYLSDRMLCWQSVNGDEGGKVAMPLDLQLLELTAFDAQSGTLLMQFFLSPYGSACGTAAFDMETGTFTMLQKDRYQVSFCGDDMYMLSFDNDKMGYSVLYGGGDEFRFADAGIFTDTGSDLYAIDGSPYLMGVTVDHSTLYATGRQITACSLRDCGISGEMHSVCYLPDEDLLVGTVYQDGAFRFYAIDPAQLPFTELADSAPADSPLTVDDALAQSYWISASGAPVAESLQDARQYADTLEEKYGVQILLSSQCKDAAALCDRAITLTDTMRADEELNSICTMLEALDRSLALYPTGFPAQFRNGMGDGGLCFLLVEHIESNFGVAGCTYEIFQWQYIALDVRQTCGPDGIICHEIWHATENHIFSQDYTALPLDEWDALNPESFSYTDYDTRVDPTYPGLLYTSDPENIHFVDDYGCVNRQEDRARIMEYFMTYEDEAQILIQSPFIRQKLQMMCDAVRSTFDTTGWENVRWERLL